MEGESTAVESANDRDVPPESGIDRWILDRVAAALEHLHEAALLSRHLRRGVWDFAVSIGTLRRRGLDDNDLRWLMSRGWVESARETPEGAMTRQFSHQNSLTFTRRTCVALTPLGVQFVESLRSGDEPAEQPQALPASVIDPPRPCSRRPVWDRDRRELRVGQTVVKKFKLPAINQETVLAAFEEEGWPVHIDDPLPPRAELNPKCRLHDTINSLNRNQKQPLLRFLGDGTGQGVRWEFAPAGDGHEDGRLVSSGSANLSKTASIARRGPRLLPP